MFTVDLLYYGTQNFLPIFAVYGGFPLSEVNGMKAVLLGLKFMELFFYCFVNLEREVPLYSLYSLILMILLLWCWMIVAVWRMRYNHKCVPKLSLIISTCRHRCVCVQLYRAYDKNSLLSCHNVLTNQNRPDNCQN